MKTTLFYFLCLGAALCLSGFVSDSRGKQRWTTPHQAPFQKDSTGISMTTGVDNIYLCPDKKTIYLSINLQAESDFRSIPLNLTVIMDRSGSMEEEGRMGEAIEGLEYIIDQLGSEDILSIVAYSHQAELVHEAVPVTDKQTLKRVIESIYPHGGTNIGSGLDLGFKEVALGYNPQKINRMFLLTDGLVNEGITDESVLKQMVKNYSRKNNVSLSAFGLGHHYNEHLLHDLAEAGGGHYYHIDKPEDVRKDFGLEIDKLSAVVGRNANISVQFPAAEMKVVRVFGHNSVVYPGNIYIDLKEVHPNEQVKILVQLELTKEVTSPLDFYTTLNYEDVVRNQSFSATQQQTIIPTQNQNDCDNYINDYVMDKVLWFNSNDLLESAMRDAEKNEMSTAAQKVAQSQTMLKGASDTTTTHYKDQLHVIDTYDKHLDNWHKKSSSEKAATHKEMRHQNYKARRLHGVDR